MKDTKYQIIKWADVGCPNCGFNRKIELICPEDVSQMAVMPAFSICWQCHYVGQIAVGQVSRRTPLAPDAAPRPPFLDMFAGAARVTQTVRRQLASREKENKMWKSLEERNLAIIETVMNELGVSDIEELPAKVIELVEKSRRTPRALDGLYCQLCGELLSEHLVTEQGGHCQPAHQ